jgi:hypothetical protein
VATTHPKLLLGILACLHTKKLFPDVASALMGCLTGSASSASLEMLIETSLNEKQPDANVGIV